MEGQIRSLLEQRRRFLEPYFASFSEMEAAESPEAIELSLLAQGSLSQMVAQWEAFEQDLTRELAFLEEELAFAQNLDVQKDRLAKLNKKLDALIQQRDSVQ